MVASVCLSLLLFASLTGARRWLAWHQGGRIGALYPRLRTPLHLLSYTLCWTVAVAPVVSPVLRPLLWGWTQAQGLALLTETSFALVALRGTLSQRSWAEMLRILIYLVIAYELVRQAATVDGQTLAISSTLASLGIGAALKPALQDLASGLILRLSRPYDIGNLVRIGPSEGLVDSLDWRSTGIELTSGSHLVIPNAAVGREVITNFSRPSPRHQHQLKLSFDPHQSPSTIREALTASVRDLEPTIEQPIDVYLHSFESGWCTYQLSFWLASAVMQQPAEVEIATHLTYALRRRGWLPIGPNRVFHQA